MPPLALPNAVVGEVVTRFPPEPSWVLDLGHCKAALTNDYVAQQFQGEWILRFDDTNPKACCQANVDAYLKELPLLGLRPHRVTFASDHFGAMAEEAARLVEAGFVYADDTPVEEMRAQRLAKQASPQRARSAADSLAAWAQMRAGSEAGRAFCLRFRLDPASENGALRDPVAWRCMDAPHYRTGTRYLAYPTYDFAAPYLDAAEGVTHALRTLEFRDRDVLYRAVQQAILQHHPEWRASNIWEFPRIHMSYTPQYKAHQKALVAAGLVEGPSDPRLPTLAGLMRAGCHPDALKAFLLQQVTPARRETYHSWDKLWTLSRRLLDPTAARHMAVADEGRVLVTVEGGPESPEPCEVTWKQGHVVRVVRCKHIWIDQDDARLLEPGDQVTLLAWGNATITSVTTTSSAGPAQTQGQPQDQHQQQQQLEQQHDATCHVSSSSFGGDGNSTSSSPATCKAALAPPPQPAAAGGPASAPQARSAAKAAPPAQPPAAAAPSAAADAACAQQAPGALLAFDRYQDVLAMHDSMSSSGGARAGLVGGSSSCASTAGSASVAALGGLCDVEEGEEEEAEAQEQGQQTEGGCRQRRQQEGGAADDAAAAGLGPTARAAAAGGRPPPPPAAAAAGAAVTRVTAVLNPGGGGGDPKASKLKVHWLPALPGQQLLPLVLVRYSHPVRVERVTEEVDVVAAFNSDSRQEAAAWGDPSLLLSARKGCVVQLQRKGFFIIDQVVLAPGASAAAAEAAAPLAAPAGAAAAVPVGAEVAGGPGDGGGGQQQQQRLQRSDVERLVLIYIPDGHTKSEARAAS